MLKIKKLTLKNYAGFRSAEFDFCRPDGSFKPVNMFFGPNGCGKSTALQAINILCQARMYVGRQSDLIFRKLTFHPDYDPTLPHFAKYADEMRLEGVFDLCGVEKKVIISTTNGVEQNDLQQFSNVVFIDADHPMNMKKFQIPADRIEVFKDVARAVYGYEVSLEKTVETYESSWDGRKDSYEKFKTDEKKVVFYQDFILDKGDVKVHFKSMSDGERKIATLLRSLCDPTTIDRSDIVLIDNVEMHVYMARHGKMIKKILESFPTKQFIMTSHSPILIGVNDQDLGIFIQSYVGTSYGPDCLFDVMNIKGQPLTV